MKFALVNGQRQEAQPNLSGKCQAFGHPMIARCGEVRIWHWAHKRGHQCDTWWENETEWHRTWKEQFPDDWQEVVHKDTNGEKHIADVKTESGCVIEFQHSYLKPEERRSRNAFYPKLVWVVDGLRRPTDTKQFRQIIEERSTVMCKEPLILRVNFPQKCRLLKEWDNNTSLVFFDFQEVNSPKQLQLWFLYPKASTNDTYIATFPRSYFIELLNNGKFEELVKNTIIPNRKELEKANKFNAGCKALRGT